MPFDIHGYLTEIDTGRIDTEYMNDNFQKWLKRLDAGGKELERALEELHGTFASLDKEQQVYAESVIHAAECGELDVREGMTFLDYINEFQLEGKNAQVKAIVDALGVDEKKLKELMSYHVDESNIDQFGRFTALKDTVDRSKAQKFLSGREGKSILPYQVSIKVDTLLRNFILSGGFDL